MNIKALTSFLEDQKNIEEMARLFKEQAMKRLHDMERMKRFFNDDESFEELVMRVIEKNDQRWAEVCHKKGVQAHPWNILYSLYHIAEEEGSEAEPVDGFTESFPSHLIFYRGLTFAITHGQGSVLSIYKGTDLIYRD